MGSCPKRKSVPFLDYMMQKAKSYILLVCLSIGCSYSLVFASYSKGYTKHYYAGSERLATVIGGGGFGDMTTPIESLTTDEYNDLVAPFWDRYSPHTEDPFYHDNALSEEVITFDIEGDCIGELQYHCHSMPLEYVDALYQDYLLFSAIHDYQQEIEIEKDIYFYHGDHLGSANWITDAYGDPVQYIHYAPYGELIAN